MHHSNICKKLLSSVALLLLIFLLLFTAHQAVQLLFVSSSVEEAAGSSTSLLDKDSAAEDSFLASFSPTDEYRGLSFLRSTYTDASGFEIPYSLYFPMNYDPEESYPLMLYLHEAGARGTDNRVQENTVPGFLDAYLSGGYAETYPAFLLIPQCAPDLQWVDVPWASGYYSLEEVPVSDSLAAVTSLVQSLSEASPLDASRLYVLGLSMGGYGTWDMISRNPNLFAAAVPVCGGADPAAAQELINLPVWTFHGSEDPIVPTWGTRDMVLALEEAGSAVIRYTEYPGAGHVIEGEAFYEEELFDWLFLQTKE